MADPTLTAALAGLLHDIGKVAVRAGERGSLPAWDSAAQGAYGQYHAALTADFVARYVPSQWREVVKAPAGNHHRPSAPADHVIAIADHLSAGERDDAADDVDRKAQPGQLLSIFSVLRADGQSAPEKRYWPVRPLSAEDETAVFPIPERPADVVWGDYEASWSAFRAAADALRRAHEGDGDLATYLESLQMLMQRYTAAMPAAFFGGQPDVSLYDHSRMTGALAAVLTRWPADAIEALSNVDLPTSKTPVALLVGGDLSGIQEFIYTITARGAASALRGRSFYLQLVTEAAMRFVLRELDLPSVTVVYAGGGKFYLLARKGDEQALAGLQQRVSAIMKRHHAGELHLSLSYVPLAAADFFGGRISAQWRALSELQGRQKLRRFAELPDLADLFLPQGTGGDALGQCAVCGNEHPRVGDDRGTRKCAPCLSYEDLGDQLRRAAYLVHEEIPPGAAAEQRGGWREALAEFGMRFSVAEDIRDVKAMTGVRRVIHGLSDAALADLAPLGATATGRRMFTNVTPILRDDEIAGLRRAGVTGLPAAGSIKPFDAMEAQSIGVKRLGVLRMDVDNLGRLFANEATGPANARYPFGLGARATLSRVAHLSFAINFFFEGWVARLAQSLNARDPRGERLYSIYSGGDDLFFVGAWDAIMTLAGRIRDDLGRYAAGHPGIHASAGIALVGGKYPLHRAAEDAAEAEQRAKRHRPASAGRPGQDKDAVSFLDIALKWDDFARVEALAKELAGWCESGQAPRSLLQTLQALELLAARHRAGLAKAGRPAPRHTQATWLAAYQLTRQAELRSCHADVKQRVREIRDALLAPDAPVRDYALAARWAQLMIRG